MAKSQGELIREALLALEKMKAELVSATADIAYEADRRHAVEADVAALRGELADFRRRSRTWTQRW